MKHRHRTLNSELLITAIATMVVLWDAVVMVLTPVLTVVSLLLVLVITTRGLVALYYNWRVLLGHWWS